MRSWLKRQYDKCVKPQTIYGMTSWFSHWNAKFRRRCNCRSFEAEAIPLASRALSHKSCQWWIIFSGMPEFHLGSLVPSLSPVSSLKCWVMERRGGETHTCYEEVTDCLSVTPASFAFLYIFCFELKYMKWIIFRTAHRYESEHDLNFKRNEQTKRLKNNLRKIQAWALKFELSLSYILICYLKITQIGAGLHLAIS